MKALGLTSRPPVGETHSNFNWVETYQPTLKKDQISLQVKATALNVDDIHIAEGTAFGGIPMGLPKPNANKPLILGMDVCGIVDAVGDKIDVIMDSGVQRGTHVLKALSLGAKAVGGGRFYLYPLAAAGQPGVERALELMRTEIERGMRLMGCKSVSDLSSSNLRFR